MTVDTLVEETQQALHLAHQLEQNLAKVMHDKTREIRLALIALFTGGHLLIEDVPGMGKTLLAKSLAQSIHGTFQRVQGTPDLLPSDITGVSVFQLDTSLWEFRPGPIFANVLIIDEINRATPRAQAALLEAMAEGQVTVDGTTQVLPDPFFVVATQNPHEHHGTFPLVEGQKDRFALSTGLGYPTRQNERALLLGQGGIRAFVDLAPVVTLAGIQQVTTSVRQIYAKEEIVNYVLDVTTATRAHPDIQVGASPRASLDLLHSSQAHALLAGRSYVTPADVQAVATAVLAHRIILRNNAAHTQNFEEAREIVTLLLSSLTVPRK